MVDEVLANLGEEAPQVNDLHSHYHTLHSQQHHTNCLVRHHPSALAQQADQKNRNRQADMLKNLKGKCVATIGKEGVRYECESQVGSG